MGRYSVFNMDNSWVKLYRKIAENDILFDDKALRLFIWLLTGVDKTTGTITIGRKWASKCVKLNPNTFYKVLSRLEKKYKIVTTKSNNHFTKVSLINWAKYQDNEKKVTGGSNNKVTTKEQQSNTYTRSKNKEDINTNGLVSFLEEFNILFNTKFRETPTRVEKYTLRRKSYSDGDILTALRNMASNTFYKGENERGWRADPDFLLRNDEQIDRFLNMKPKDVFSPGFKVFKAYETN